MLLEHIFKITNTCNNCNYTTNNKYNNQQETTSNIECNKCNNQQMHNNLNARFQTSLRNENISIPTRNLHKKIKCYFSHLFAYSRILTLNFEKP